MLSLGHKCWRNHARACAQLKNLDADSRVFTHSAENLVVHPEGLDERFEGTKPIDRADKVVEENYVPALEMPGQGGQNEERGAEEISVQMNHQSPGEIVSNDKREQRVLKKADLETATRVLRIGEPSVHVERTLGLSTAPSFGETRKRVESYEAGFRTGNVLEPPEQGVSTEDTKFPKVDGRAVQAFFLYHRLI